jgi:hypothetical protein
MSRGLALRDIVRCCCSPPAMLASFEPMPQLSTFVDRDVTLILSLAFLEHHTRSPPPLSLSHTRTSLVPHTQSPSISLARARALFLSHLCYITLNLDRPNRTRVGDIGRGRGADPTWGCPLSIANIIA